MTKTDTPTPSTSLRDPRGSLTVRMYGSLTALPRLVSGAVVSFFAILAVFFSDVSIALAAGADGGGNGNSLQNPLQYSGIADFIAGALKVMVEVALPIISLFIVYSGFLFVSARGSTEGLQKAKLNFFYVVIGAILILGAWVIATLIGGTVTQLTR